MGRKKVFYNIRRKGQHRKCMRLKRMNNNEQPKGTATHVENPENSTHNEGIQGIEISQQQSLDDCIVETRNPPVRMDDIGSNSEVNHTLPVSSTKRGLSTERVNNNKKANNNTDNPIICSVNNDAHISRDVKQCANRFYKKIKEGPIYCCVSCKRLLFRNSVLKFKADRYAKELEGTISQFLSEDSIHVSNEQFWVCHTCHNTLKRSKQPVQCQLNNLTLDTIPEELMDLRPLEQRLISQRIVFMKLVALPKGGQKSIQGPAVNVPSKLNNICTVLPRLPSTAHVVPFKLKRKLIYKGHYMHEYIRPDKIMKALRWLINSNELYKDIQICQNWEQQWSDGDHDLWQAIVTADSEPDRNHEHELPTPRDRGQSKDANSEILPMVSCSLNFQGVNNQSITVRLPV